MTALCSRYNNAGTCIIKAPNIIRESWNTVGWNIDINEIINNWSNSISKNEIYYAITRFNTTAINLIMSGSFENGDLDSWNVIGGDRSNISLNNDYKIYGTSSVAIFSPSTFVENYIYSVNSFIRDTSQLYYCSVMYYLPIDSSVSVTLFVLGGGGLPNSSVTASSRNNWNKLSLILNAWDIGVGTAVFRVDNNNEYRDAMVYFDGALCINLTETFGVGNEPDKSWCDLNINWFDGSTELTAYNQIN